MLQHAAHSHGTVVVNEIVWRIVGNSEEQVFYGGKRGGFAGFVRPEYDVQVGIRFGKRQGDVSKESISQKIEPVDAQT